MTNKEYYYNLACHALQNDANGTIYTTLDNMLEGKSQQEQINILIRHSCDNPFDRLEEYKQKVRATNDYLYNTGYFAPPPIEYDPNRMRRDGLTNREHKQYIQAREQGNNEILQKLNQKKHEASKEKIENNEFLRKAGECNNKFSTDHASETKKSKQFKFW